MTVFSIAAAALLLAACLFVLVPLLRAQRLAPAGTSSASNLAVLREQQALLDADLAAARIDAAQHAAARAELERRVLEEEVTADAAPRSGRSTVLAAVLGLAVPLFAAGVYLKLGNPAALSVQASAPAAGRSDVTQQDVEAMVAKLAERMESQPGDPKGWVMLGRSYAAMQRFPEAGKAYARAMALTPNDAQVLVDYADVLAAQAQSAVGEPTRLITRALQIEPANLKGLALAGSAAFERKDFAAAIAYWTQARTVAPAGSEFAQGLDSSLAEAKAALGNASGAVAGTGAAPGGLAAASSAQPAAPATTGGVAPGTEQLAGRVALAPALAGRVGPDDTVFVYARAAEGPRMPLAIQRRKASELPFTFKLDDSMAMSPEMKLSKFGRVIVEARVSKTGEALARPGDLRGQIGPLAPGGTNLSITIDSVQP